MRYIKTYEEVVGGNVLKYFTNDYVILDSNDYEWHVDTCVKIVDVSIIVQKYKKITMRLKVEAIDKRKNNDIITFWINEDEIDRYATPEEIEEYEIKIKTNKYNL